MHPAAGIHGRAREPAHDPPVISITEAPALVGSRPVLCRKCRRTSKKDEPQALETAFVDGLNDGGLSRHFGERALKLSPHQRV